MVRARLGYAERAAAGEDYIFELNPSNVRRSPLPKLIGERKWKRLVGEELAPAIDDLVRTSAMGGGKTRGVLTVPHDAGAVTLHPVVEPLQVHNETLGGLIIFPSGEGLDDLDAMVAQAAKLALNVQFMRDHLRFRSEANSLAEVFHTLFAGAPRHPSEVVARARRLNVSLPGPARLIAIAFPNDGSGPGEPQSAGLHLTLARCAADLRSGAAVIMDDDLQLTRVSGNREEGAGSLQARRQTVHTPSHRVGGNGFSFIDKLSYATTPDQLAWAVAHNVAHELMHSFGVAIHPEIERSKRSALPFTGSSRDHGEVRRPGTAGCPRQSHRQRRRPRGSGMVRRVPSNR
jgi:hypothetical protein